jgi:hypothetical protein
MAKRYIRINFQNSPSTVTPLNATNLNKIDKGIDDLDNAIEAINDNLATVITMTSGVGTITGGYIKSGKVIAVSAMAVTNAQQNAGAVIASGISPSLFEISGLLCKDGGSGANIEVYIYNGDIITKNILPIGTYVITGGYISAV